MVSKGSLLVENAAFFGKEEGGEGKKIRNFPMSIWMKKSTCTI